MCLCVRERCIRCVVRAACVSIHKRSCNTQEGTLSFFNSSLKSLSLLLATTIVLSIASCLLAVVPMVSLNPPHVVCSLLSFSSSCHIFSWPQWMQQDTQKVIQYTGGNPLFLQLLSKALPSSSSKKSSSCNSLDKAIAHFESVQSEEDACGAVLSRIRKQIESYEMLFPCDGSYRTHEHVQLTMTALVHGPSR